MGKVRNCIIALSSAAAAAATAFMYNEIAYSDDPFVVATPLFHLWKDLGKDFAKDLVSVFDTRTVILAFLKCGVLYSSGYCIHSLMLMNDDERLIEELESNMTKDLGGLIDEHNPTANVALSGSVACAEPMQNSATGDLCALVEHRVTEYYKQLEFPKKRSKGALRNKGFQTSSKWKYSSASRSSTFVQRVWNLDHGNGNVRVVGAEGSSDFSLPIVNSMNAYPNQAPVYDAAVYQELEGGSRFDEFQQARFQETPNGVQVVQVLKIEMTEHALRVGSPISVIGQASRDGSGNIQIQRPPTGHFYVSCTETREELMEKITRLTWANVNKSIGWVICSACLFMTCYISADDFVTNSAQVFDRLQSRLCSRM